MSDEPKKIGIAVWTGGVGGAEPIDLSKVTSGTPISVDVRLKSADVSWLPDGLLTLVGSPVLGANVTQVRE